MHLKNKDLYNSIFIEIQEAYDVLSDVSKRESYDSEFKNTYHSTVVDSATVKESIFRPTETPKIVLVNSSIPFLKHQIEVSSRHVKYNDNEIPLENIHSIRVGYSISGLYQDDFYFIILLKTINEKTTVIHFNSLFQSVQYRHDKFQNVMTLVGHYLIPKLLSYHITQLDNSKTLTVSTKLALTRMGVIIKSKYFVPWNRVLIDEKNLSGPFYHKTQVIFISDKSNKKLATKVSPITHWNALLIPLIARYYQNNL